MNYLWCGSRLCQARNASNTVMRSYYAEGEFLPGTPAQSLYYGPDQIGSVRRVFASASSAPAFSYDPYGNALQSTAPLTDFNYAGMFFNADSGLYLTQYRAYNPAIGRWLSRDPLGERTDAYANLYPYVGNNPLSFTDPSGLSVVLGRAICDLVPGLCASPKGPPQACPRDPNAPPLLPPYMQSTDDQGQGASDQAQQPQSPQINPQDLAGKTPAEIDQAARDAGLIPKGPDPQSGRGTYIDPVTGEQRVLIHPDDPAGPHIHVNDPTGQRLDINGNVVPDDAPEAHLPLGGGQ